MDANKVEAVNS
jgi:hypothetical protein